MRSAGERVGEAASRLEIPGAYLSRAAVPMPGARAIAYTHPYVALLYVHTVTDTCMYCR